MNWHAKQIMDQCNLKPFDEVMDLLKSSPDRLSALLEKHSDSNAGIVKDGCWSANEHAGHLLTMESLWIARLDDFMSGNPVLRPWNGHNMDTIGAQYNRSRFSKIIEEFADIRTPHAKMLEKFRGKEEHLKSLNPELNRDVSLLEHVNLIWLHDLHHSNTIENLLML